VVGLPIKGFGFKLPASLDLTLPHGDFIILFFTQHFHARRLLLMRESGS